MRRDYTSARTWLRRAEARVPDEYKFGEHGLPERDAQEEPVEAYWVQMAKIALLEGSLVFDEDTEGGSKPVTQETLRDVARHYTFSVAYSEKYSERAVVLGATFRQMYDRFKTCTAADLVYLQEVLPEIARQYGIDLTRLGSFFEDTLGLAIERQR
jgi:hypothetical protein